MHLFFGSVASSARTEVDPPSRGRGRCLVRGLHASPRFLTAIALCWVCAGTAQAAKRYVAMNDSGTCSNHSSLGTGMAGKTCADSLAAGCTQAQPCCTLNEALKASVANDTIEIHNGTRVYTSSQCASDVTCVSLTSSSCNINVGAIAVTDHLTISVATGDVATLDLNNQLNTGVWIADHHISLSGIRVTGQKSSGTDIADCRVGGIQVTDLSNFNGGPSGSSVPTNTTIDGVSVAATNDSVTNTAVSGISVPGGSADNLIIRNSSISGKFAEGIYIFTGLNGAAGAAIYNNSVAGNRLGNGDARQIGIWLEFLGLNASTGTLSVYNNVIDFTSSTAETRYGWYYRESPAKAFIFNNRHYNVTEGMYLQEGGRTGYDSIERMYVFNNYFTGTTNGFHLYGCYNIFARNNIFKGFNYGIRELENGCSTGYATTPSSGDISSNFCYGVGTCISENEAGISTSNNLATGLLNATSDGHLQAGSACINTGTNNPVNQGSNTCALSGSTTPVAVNCLLDIDGDVRPDALLWDIGADEFVSVQQSIPPVTQNLRRTDRH